VGSVALGVEHVSAPLENNPSSQSASELQVETGDVQAFRISPPWVCACAVAGTNASAAMTTMARPVYSKMVLEFWFMVLLLPFRNVASGAESVSGRWR
jgi:hypothetical protein